MPKPNKKKNNNGEELKNDNNNEWNYEWNNSNKNDNEYNVNNKQIPNNSNNFGNNLTTIEQEVINIINTPEKTNTETGCDVKTILKKLSSRDIHEIRRTIDKLAKNGYIYSTVDEDHYKYSGSQ